MAPKKATTAGPVAPSTKAATKVESWPEVRRVLDTYWSNTTHQTLIIDAFLGFLVAVGGIQALYFLVCGRNVSDCPGATVQYKSANLSIKSTALQRLPCWFPCHHRPVCSHRYLRFLPSKPTNERATPPRRSYQTDSHLLQSPCACRPKSTTRHSFPRSLQRGMAPRNPTFPIYTPTKSNGDRQITDAGAHNTDRSPTTSSAASFCTCFASTT